MIAYGHGLWCMACELVKWTYTKIILWNTSASNAEDVLVSKHKLKHTNVFL